MPSSVTSVPLCFKLLLLLLLLLLKTWRSDCFAALLAAIFANAVNLEVVASGVKMVLAADLLFQLVYLRREKLDRRVTLRADHVVVIAAIELVLIARHAVRKRDGAGQSALRQQLERTVNRGEADLGVLLADEAKQLVGGKMIAGLKKGAQDGVALVSVLEPDTLQMLIKDLLRFAHGFARRRRMIVNPSLQHVIDPRNILNENEIHFHYTQQQSRDREKMRAFQNSR